MLRANHLRTLATCFALIFGATTGLSQTASEITPGNLAPPTGRLSGSIDFEGGTGLGAPEGSDKLTIRIADVTVDGTLPGMEAATEAARARLTQGRVRVSEIFETATTLEAAYADAGYALARVAIPQQSLNDGGTLQLQVIDGFVELIDLSAVPEEVRDRIAEVTAPLVGQRGVTLGEIERRLLIAGDTYGVSLGSALAAGATPGGTVIVLDPRFRSVTGFFGFDNTASSALGTYSIDAGVELNGYFGRGEVIYGRASFYPEGDVLADDPQLRTLALGAVVPLGTDGVSLNLEATNSDTGPDVAPQQNSSFDRQSIRLNYPWVRSLNRNITSEIALDFERDELFILGSQQHLDKTRVLRFSADMFRVTEDGALLELGGTLSQGIDAFGARTAADAMGGTPLSTAGADAVFTKLEVSGRYRRAINEQFSLSLSGRAQSSFGAPLVLAEQISIATPQELSLFDQGTLTGDSAWTVRMEVSHPIATEIGQFPLLTSPYLFLAVGQVFREELSFGEAGRVDATAFGIGVDLLQVRDPDFSNGSLRIELGQGDRDDGEVDGTRVAIIGTYRF